MIQSMGTMKLIEELCIILCYESSLPAMGLIAKLTLAPSHVYPLNSGSLDSLPGKLRSRAIDPLLRCVQYDCRATQIANVRTAE
jgi:hypothetical protein